VVCIIATNVASPGLLWRTNWWIRFGVKGRSFLQLYRSDAMAPQNQSMVPGSQQQPMFYSTNQKSSVAIFIGKPI